MLAGSLLMEPFYTSFERLCHRLFAAAAREPYGFISGVDAASTIRAIRTHSSACFLWPEFAAARSAMTADGPITAALTALPGGGHSEPDVALFQLVQQFTEDYALATTSGGWRRALYQSLETELRKGIETNSTHLLVTSLLAGVSVAG